MGTVGFSVDTVDVVDLPLEEIGSVYTVRLCNNSMVHNVFIEGME